MSSSKVKCTCGWSWNKSDSSKKDMYICHECGRDNSNNMKNGGWLDNYNDSEVSLPEGYVGEGYDTSGRDYSPAWGGQFQMGGQAPKRRGVRYNEDGSVSTHLMKTETDGKGNWFSFPTLFQNSIPYADDSENWLDMSDRPWEEAYEEAKKRGEVINFGSDKDAAIKFGQGSWKDKKQMGGSIYPVNYVPEAQMGGSIPGSVGFTYARTNSPAPSNGKYAKKTMASAQDGKKTPKLDTTKLDFSIPKSTGYAWADEKLKKQKKALDEFKKVKTKVDTEVKKIQKKHDIPESTAREVYKRQQDLSEQPIEEVRQYTPQSTLSKVKEIALNPMTAAGYKVRNEDIPENFSRSEDTRNNLDTAVDFINPVWYAESAKNLVQNQGQVFSDLSEGNFQDAGINQLMAGVEALNFIPLAKGAKPLLNKGMQQLKNIPTNVAPELRQGLRTAGPSFGSSTKNLEDLEAVQKFAKQYGYDLPTNLKRIAQSDVLTDRTVRGIMNRHNTFVRGVSTNWDELAKRNPDILKNLEERGINWKDNPEEAAKLMLTEIPPDTGYGRYMMNKGENALYTSNSIPTAQGYTYGDGYYAKLRRKNLDYSSNNRQDWINNNQLDYQKGINNPEGANIIKTDWQKRFPTSIEEFVKGAGNPNLLDDLMNKVDLKVKNKKSIIDKELDKNIDVRKNIYKKAEEEMKKIYPDKTFHHDDYFDIRDSFITKADKKALDFTAKKIDKFRAFDPIKYEENQAIKEIFTTPEFYKSAFRNLIKPDKFGHYAFKGNPGEQIFDIVDLKKMTPEFWKEKSRAHIGKYSKKLSAMEEGGIIKDDRGQWNHPGKITQIAQEGKEITVDEGDGKKRKILTDSKEYADLFNQGKIGVKNDDESISMNPLNEVVVTPYDKQYPFYQELSDEEKKYFNSDSPIGRQLRSRAQDNVGFNADKAADFAMGWLRDLPLASLQAPQSALVEGVEALRGNESDILSALRPGEQRTASDAWGYQNPEGFWQNAANIGMDVVLDPSNIAGASIVKSGLKQGVKKGLKKATSSVDDVGRGLTQIPEAPKAAWQMEELPGLHLKSTMEGQAISKIVEPKTGLVNVEQALGIIGKESGGADKVALIKQGLGENIPKKMDYNEFRKVVQDQLIPLERQFATNRSGYGIDSIGYTDALSKTDYANQIKYYDEQIKRMSKYSDKGFKKELDKFIKEKEQFIKSQPLENQTLILGNKDKFGRGSSAHGNPDETLGHIHFLRDAETPDVLTVTQIQSDAFQGTHRTMPKNAPDVSKVEKSLQRMQELQERNKSVLNKMKTEGVDEAGLPVQQYQIKQFEDIVQAQEAANLMKKGEVENFTQKSLLDKNHQERYLQELVDYAGKRGDVNKVRVPTSETAAKIQGYKPATTAEELIEKHNKLKGTTEWDEIMSATPDADKVRFEKVLKGEIKGDIYNAEHQTILKKYSEQPKTIKKLFGQEPKIVTDSKGNTWYEFDIPKKFKQGKGEIKAFSSVGAIGTAGVLSQTEEEFIPGMKQGGIIKDDMGYWNPDNWGEVVEIDSNDITMKGVYEPLIGISDTGDTKLMQPGKDYKFKGKKVTEYPLAKDGKELVKLNQLTNFTNYNKPTVGGWLDKY